MELTVSDAPAEVTATDTGTGTVNNDDSATVTISTESEEEGDTITFTVTLDNAVAGGFTATPDYAGGGSAGSEDYTANTNALSFSGEAGEKKTFTIATTEDTVVEGDEFFKVGPKISGLSEGVPDVTEASGVGTIEDDDTSDITLSVDPSSVVEDGGAKTVTVTAATDGDTFPADLTVTVSVGDSDDDATEGTDYTTVDDVTITITAGQIRGSGTFTLTPTDDKIVEGDETIKVSGTATDLTVTPTSVTLTDDDSTGIALSVDLSSVWEDVETAPTVTVTASTDGDTFKTDRTVTVTVGKNGDTATSGTDYEAVTAFDITITAGQTSGTGTFDLKPENDNLIEGDESITVDGTSTGLKVTPTEVTLADDDNVARLTQEDDIVLKAAPSSMSEGDESMDVTVTAEILGNRAYPEDKTVTVSVGDDKDSATEGTDYTTVDDVTITITAGQTSGEGYFTLKPVDDSVVEGAEVIGISGEAGDLRIRDEDAKVTLTDNDVVTLSVADASASEGDAMTFAVTLGTSVQRGLTVTPVFTDVTAEKGVDYTENAEPLTFAGAAGEVRTLTVATVEDELIEPDETFTVSILGFAATGTIVNDDIAAAAVADTSADEGEVLVFTVTLDKAAAADGLVTMDYATEDGSARAGKDYTAVSGTLSFPAGETEATIEVETIDDALDEGEETLHLLLSRPVNAVLSDALGRRHHPQQRSAADGLADAVRAGCGEPRGGRGRGAAARGGGGLSPEPRRPHPGVRRRGGGPGPRSMTAA